MPLAEGAIAGLGAAGRPLVGREQALAAVETAHDTDADVDLFVLAVLTADDAPAEEPWMADHVLDVLGGGGEDDVLTRLTQVRDLVLAGAELVAKLVLEIDLLAASGRDGSAVAQGGSLELADTRLDLIKEGGDMRWDFVRQAHPHSPIRAAMRSIRGCWTSRSAFSRLMASQGYSPPATMCEGLAMAVTGVDRSVPSVEG